MQEIRVQSLGQEDPLEEGRNGNPLQYSCLEKPMDREAWWATAHGVAQESDTTYQLNNKISVCSDTWLCTFSPAVYSSMHFCSLLHQHLVLSEFFIFYHFIGFKMLSWSLCIFLREEDLFMLTGHVLNLCSCSC